MKYYRDLQSILPYLTEYFTLYIIFCNIREKTSVIFQFKKLVLPTMNIHFFNNVIYF